MPQGKTLSEYAIILSEKDNVATALVDMPISDYVFNSGDSQTTITVPEDIKAGFKLALYDIGEGEPIYKYGYIIGTAKSDIKKGQFVHVHNLVSSI